jgi:probable rRNA maturation factor
MIELTDADEIGSSTAARSDAGPHVTVDVVAEDACWIGAVPGVESLVRRAAAAALAESTSRLPLALTVVLGDAARVRALNRTWRGIDKATNVLSFPARELGPGRPLEPAAGQPPDEPIELGDVVLARETVLAEAADEIKAPGDHVAHLVVHGVLHLLGHDHEDGAEAERMEALERCILNGLGIADPYAED